MHWNTVFYIQTRKRWSSTELDTHMESRLPHDTNMQHHFTTIQNAPWSPKLATWLKVLLEWVAWP